MLIVSEFHDYYDTVTAWGVDKAVVYNRHSSDRRRVRPEDANLTIHTAARRYYRAADFPQIQRKRVLLSMRVIGFCGKMYPFMEINEPQRRLIVYDCESAQRSIEGALFSSYGGLYLGHGLTSEKALEQHFDPATYVEFLRYFHENKCPVFICGQGVASARPDGHARDEIVINPQLRQWGFERIKPPAQAFQDIYQYISGVLGVGAPQTVTIDDKHKAIAHGHDGKYSFRKPPGGGQWR